MGRLIDFENLLNFLKVSGDTIVNLGRIHQINPLSRTSHYIDTGLKSKDLQKKAKFQLRFMKTYLSF